MRLGVLAQQLGCPVSVKHMARLWQKYNCLINRAFSTKIFFKKLSPFIKNTMQLSKALKKSIVFTAEKILTILKLISLNESVWNSYKQTMGSHQPQVAVLVPDKKLDRFVRAKFFPLQTKTIQLIIRDQYHHLAPHSLK